MASFNRPFSRGEIVSYRTLDSVGDVIDVYEVACKDCGCSRTPDD